MAVALVEPTCVERAHLDDHRSIWLVFPAVLGDTLDISCSARDEAVTIVSTESGGPRVEEPRVARGHGSKLLERSVAGHLRGAIFYDCEADGLVVTLKVNPDRLAQ
ncbi:hypothetical protein X738_31815 [Mesorhizobium sp. LNHC209A00]|nr:hypothetical protein X738_31815 [Mesorhizobium sp. LNHC209A00]